MKTLLKGGTVVNVFTDELEKANVLIEDERIIGVGDYSEADADCVHDVSGKYICPGFIDGHIHIESTMMLPAEFARAAVLHGTSAVVSDPHEIAKGFPLICILWFPHAYRQPRLTNPERSFPPRI